MAGPWDAETIARAVAQVAERRERPGERATAFLEPLPRLLPFDGAWLALRDEQRRGHESLVSTGWVERTASYLDGPVLLAALGPTLGHALDPLRSTAVAARLVHAPTAAVTLTRTGRVLPLPGLAGHPLLEAGSPVLTAARELLDGPHVSFLVPAPDEPGGYLTVTALDAPDDAPHQLSGIVVLSPCGDLQGLTRRELEVLGLVIAGCRNAEAARCLTVTPRTIATHVEHILTKLAADSRALAAVRAQRRGLYIPLALLAR